MNRYAWLGLLVGLIVQSAVLSHAATTQPADAPDRPAVKRDTRGQPESSFLAQHANIMASKANGPFDVIFIGDSITANWRKARKVWDSQFGRFRPANFGIGGDKTQHILWRLSEGELDGLKPKVIVLLVGGNNLRLNADQITTGVKAVLSDVQTRVPEAKVLLIGILPRGFDPNDRNDKKGGNVPVARAKTEQVNANLARLDDGRSVRYLELKDIFLDDKGFIPPDLMADALHPTPAAYALMADRIRPMLDEMIK